MSDDSTPPPDGNASENSSSSISSDTFDFPALLNAAKELFLKPLAALDTIKAIVKDPGGYFSSKEDGSINDSLGFFLVTTAVMLVFGLLGAIFSLNFVAFFLAVPFGLTFALLKLAIGSAVLFLIAKYLAKGEGSFWEATKITCRLSWIFLIPAFPLFVFFPGLLNAIIMIAAYLLWAYLAIPSVAVRYKITDGKHAIALWAVSGVLSIIVLMGAFAGKAVETAGDFYVQQAEDMQKEILKNVEAVQKEAMDSYNQALAQANAQVEAARRAEEQKQASTAAAAAAGEESPAK
jgi:ABC-type multidrug transport system fused ATPase/permease subunit